MSTTRTFVCSVNTFPEKSFGKNKRRLQPLRRAFFRSTRVIWRGVLKEGRAENADSRTGFKPFLEKVLHITASSYQATGYATFLPAKTIPVFRRRPARFLYPIY
jgi:hypothetical protein